MGPLAAASSLSSAASRRPAIQLRAKNRNMSMCTVTMALAALSVAAVPRPVRDWAAPSLAGSQARRPRRTWAARIATIAAIGAGIITIAIPDRCRARFPLGVSLPPVRRG